MTIYGLHFNLAGDFLWEEEWVFSSIHGPGESFISDSIAYKVCWCEFDRLAGLVRMILEEIVPTGDLYKMMVDRSFTQPDQIVIDKVMDVGR